MACGKCGFTSNRGDKQVSRLAHEREKIVVIGREEQKIRTLPKAKAECPKCNNHEAFYWLVQTRGGDESSTPFFRCTNCGATWREKNQKMLERSITGNVYKKEKPAKPPFKNNKKEGRDFRHLTRAN